MPIYMDRHDVSETVTAANVAQLHQEDLKIQHEFNCRGLTYWYDDTKKMAFCLIEAPDKEALYNMHKHAHGEVPNLIIEVDENIVESFLGRIQDPVNTLSSDLNIIDDPAERTLMVVRYHTSSLQGINHSASDSNMHQTIVAISSILKQHEGRLTEHQDGYLLISFKSAYQSVMYALDLNKLFKSEISSLYNFNIELKIGLSTGVPVEKNKSFFEDTIKMANRLCFIDKANIVMTSDVLNTFITANLDAPYDKDSIYALPPSEENILQTLVDFVDQEWKNDKLLVDDFDKPLGMSRSQVYRKVTFLTGKSPNSFLKEYRLNKALRMINKNTHSIAEIAYETGFNSPSYFSKCFQRRFGLLPSEYINT